MVRWPQLLPLSVEPQMLSAPSACLRMSLVGLDTANQAITVDFHLTTLRENQNPGPSLQILGVPLPACSQGLWQA